MLSIMFQHISCKHDLTFCTVGSYNIFKVVMNTDFFTLRDFKLMCSHTYTTFDVLSNETKLNLLAVRSVWAILAFPVVLMFQRFQNPKIALAPELLLARYPMIHQFYTVFYALSKYFFLRFLAVLFWEIFALPVFLRV